MAGALVWDVERMRSIVEEWDAALRAELPAYQRLVPAAEARGSLLRPPATPEAVAAVEGRLAVRLPAAYRSFLLIADGADAGAQGRVAWYAASVRSRRGSSALRRSSRSPRTTNLRGSSTCGAAA